MTMSDIIINGQYNIGHICTRQQCEAGLGSKMAMRWISPEGERRDFTFSDLEQKSNRYANMLASLGYEKGDVLFTFLPKIPEQFFTVLGSLKLQLVTGTLFSNFGEDALLDRLGDSRAKVVVTKKSLAKKISKIRDQLPQLRHIIITDADSHEDNGTLSLRELLKGVSPSYETPLTLPDTPSLVHYTSGSTGKPKGVQHVHRSVLMQSYTTHAVLGLRSDDIFWCTADQGWVTGTSYGIIGPWSLGVTQVHFGGVYNAEEWFSVLEQEKITVWYTAPTALRMLMREDNKIYGGVDLSNLRSLFSVGEPLNPEVIHWARRVLKKDIYDTWFQTETGAIMITNREGMDIRPGSMGKPISGIEPAIIADDGTVIQDSTQGNLCLQIGWDSMFVTYLNNEAAYRSKMKGGYYYTGDTAYRDQDGYYWFMGRSDDVINTAGHLVSPFEVESTLLEMPEVAEAGVIGVPDEILFEKIVAFVSLHKGCEFTPELALRIRIHVSNRLSSLATPQETFCIDNIPKNKSGKIMRRVLKARYMGTDAGDISTLEI